MARKDLKEEIEVPQGVSVAKEDSLYVFSGPGGTVKKKMNNPKVELKLEGNKLTLLSKNASKNKKAIFFAYKSHIENALQGCKEPYVYKLKVCSGHFPMTTTVSNGEFVIKNFLGEKVPRKIKIKDGVTVKVDGAQVVVSGADKERAGQVAADIEQATRRPGFDKRIFQDGIYMTEKAGKKI